MSLTRARSLGACIQEKNIGDLLRWWTVTLYHLRDLATFQHILPVAVPAPPLLSLVLNPCAVSSYLAGSSHLFAFASTFGKHLEFCQAHSEVEEERDILKSIRRQNILFLRRLQSDSPFHLAYHLPPTTLLLPNYNLGDFLDRFQDAV